MGSFFSTSAPDADAGAAPPDAVDDGSRATPSAHTAPRPGARANAGGARTFENPFPSETAGLFELLQKTVQKLEAAELHALIQSVARDVDTAHPTARTHTHTDGAESGDACPQCANERARTSGLRAPDNIAHVLLNAKEQGVRNGTIIAVTAAALMLRTCSAPTVRGAQKALRELCVRGRVDEAFAIVLRLCFDCVDDVACCATGTPASTPPAHSNLVAFGTYLRKHWGSPTLRRAVAAAMVPPFLRKETLQQLFHNAARHANPVVTVLTSTAGPGIGASQTERVLQAIDRATRTVSNGHCRTTVADILGAIPAVRFSVDGEEHEQWKRTVLAWYSASDATRSATDAAGASSARRVSTTIEPPCGDGTCTFELQVESSDSTSTITPDLPTISSASDLKALKEWLEYLFQLLAALLAWILQLIQVVPGQVVNWHVCVCTGRFGDAIAAGMLEQAPEMHVRRAAHLGTVFAGKPASHAPLRMILDAEGEDADGAYTRACNILQELESARFHSQSLYQQVAIIGFRDFDGAVPLTQDLLAWETFQWPRRAGRAGASSDASKGKVDKAASYAQHKEANRNSEHSTRKCTINTLLTSHIPGVNVEDMTRRLEALVLYVSLAAHRGSLLLRFFLLSALENNRELPDGLLKDTMYHQAFNITAKLRKPTPGLQEMFRAEFSDFPEIPRIEGGGATQALMFAAQGYKGSFLNNIRLNLASRIHGNVLLMLDSTFGADDWGAGLRPPRARDLSKDAASKVAKIICARIGGWKRASPKKDNATLRAAGIDKVRVAEFIQRMRDDLGLVGVAQMTDAFLGKNSEERFGRLLRCTYQLLAFRERYVERYKAANGGDSPHGVHLFNILPYKELAVNHIRIDVRIVREYLLRGLQLPERAEDVWALILNSDTLKRLGSKGYTFAGTFTTDGVSAGVHFSRPRPQVPASVPLEGAGKRRRSRAAGACHGDGPSGHEDGCDCHSNAETVRGGVKKRARAVGTGAESTPATEPARAPVTSPAPECSFGGDPGRIILGYFFAQLVDAMGNQTARHFWLSKNRYRRESGADRREKDAAAWLKRGGVDKVSDALSNASTKTARVAQLRENLKAWCARSDAAPTPAGCAAGEAPTKPVRGHSASGAPVAASKPARGHAASAAAAAAPTTACATNYDRLWSVKKLRCWRHAAFRSHVLKLRCWDRFFRGMLEECGVGKQKPVMAWGAGKFASSGRGEKGGAPTSSFARRGGHHFRVHRENEFRSSQACRFDRTHQLADVFQMTTVDGKRVRRTVRGLKFCRTCFRLVNRDKNAAANILYTFTERMAGRERPAGMRFDHVKKAVKPIELQEAKTQHDKHHGRPAEQ